MSSELLRASAQKTLAQIAQRAARRTTSKLLIALAGLLFIGAYALGQDNYAVTPVTASPLSLPASCNVTTGSESLDVHGGNNNIQGTATGAWHFEQICQRLMMVTPEGHGMVIRAVTGVNTTVFGDAGGFQPYEAVYLQTNGTFSSNLQLQATDTNVSDVIHPMTQVTLSQAGDQIFFGSQMKPESTYVWANTLGAGGAIQWYYSTANGWSLINGTGNPYSATIVNSEGGYAFDIGNYIAPGRNGVSWNNNPTANLLLWWNLKTGVYPADFAPTTVAGDSVARYYIMGLVTQPFTVAPVVNQIYERDTLGIALQRKFPGTHGYLNWANDISNKLVSWGFNAVGQDSSRYWIQSPNLTTNRLPIEVSWQLSFNAIQPANASPAKAPYDTEVCPSTGALIYQAPQADMFDPNYAVLVNAEAQQLYRQLGDVSWVYGLVPEEGDDLYAFNRPNHNHFGMAALIGNPYRSSDPTLKIAQYPDVRFYAKYALRDFLRYYYAGKPQANMTPFTPDSPIPLYSYSATPTGNELYALNNLNAKWGTHYTTWGTASGNLLDGSNSYGTGSGFMDENGSNVDQVACNWVYSNTTAPNPSHPAIRQVLDLFLKQAALRYIHILSNTLTSLGPIPPIILPVYNGPATTYQEFAPYVDAFMIHPTGTTSVPQPADIKTIYKSAKKPLIVMTFLDGNPDSPLEISSQISSITFNSSSWSTHVVGPQLTWFFRNTWFVDFPSVSSSTWSACGMASVTLPLNVAWNSMDLAGDYTGCLNAGDTIEKAIDYTGNGTVRTQSQRGTMLGNAYVSLLKTKSYDGFYPVAGIEEWQLYDDAPSDWGEQLALGFLTQQGNAYDGVEARRAYGVDANGIPYGEELGDYGDVVDPIREALTGLYNWIPYQ